MTRAEATPRLQVKADELVQWFTGKTLPAAPFQSGKGHTVMDTKKYFEKQIKVMEAWRSDPFHRLFVNAYQELERLKKYMENEKSVADHLRA